MATTSAIERYFKPAVENNPLPPENSSGLWSYLNPNAYHPADAVGKAVEKQMKQVLADAGPQLKTIGANLLFAQPPAEISRLKDLLSKIISPEAGSIAPAELLEINELLRKIDRPFLETLAHGLQNQQMQPIEIKDDGFDLILKLSDTLVQGANLNEQGTHFEFTPQSLQAIKEAHALLAVLHAHGEGLMAKTMRTFTETVNQTVNQTTARCEQMVANTVHRLLPSGPAVPLAPAASDVLPNARPPDPNEFDLGKYLTIAGSWFGTLSHTLTDALSSKLIGKTASILLMVLEKGEEYTENKPEYKQAFDAIRALLPKVNKIINGKENGEENPATLSNIGSLLIACGKIVNEHQIFINGIRVPRLGGSEEIVTNSIAQYVNNLKKLNPSPASMAPPDYRAFMEIERKVFVQNTTNFVTIKTVYESQFLCGLEPPSDDFYLQILEDASKENSPNQAQEIRKKFFEKIDAAYTQDKISFFAKITSKCVYYLLSFSFRLFIDNFSQHILESIKDTVHQSFKQKADESIVNFTRYLETLGKVFERVSKRTDGNLTLMEMIEEELSSPDCNNHMTPQQLYQKIIHLAVNKYAPTLDLISPLKKWIELKKASPSPFRRRFLNPVLTVASKTLSSLFYWPQRLLNAAAFSIVKVILNRNKVVETVIDKCSASVIDKKNGYAHAMYCALYTQLQNILDLMQEVYRNNVENREFGKNGDLKNSKQLKDIDSSENKEQFKAFLKNLFETLPKGQCASRDELKKYLKNKSASAALRNLISDFVLDDTVEAGTRLKKIALETVTKDHLNAIILGFMSMVNQSFKLAVPIPAEQLKAMEIAVADRWDKIIYFAIELLQNDYDFSLKKLKAKSHAFIQGMKDAVTEFCKANRTIESQLSEIVHWDHFKSLKLVNQMRENSSKFQQLRMTAQLDATGDKFDSETKKKFDRISTELARQFSLLDQEVLNMVEVESKISQRQKTIESLKSMQQIFSEIEFKTSLFTTRVEDLEALEAYLNQLDQAITSLSPENPLATSLAQTAKLTRFKVKQLSLLRKTYDSLIFDFNPRYSKSLINRLKNEKEIQLSSPGSNNASQIIFTQCVQLLEKIPNQQTRQLLQDKLKILFTCSDLKAFNALVQNLDLELITILEEQKSQIEYTVKKIKNDYKNFNKSIQDSGEADPKDIPSLIEQVRHRLTQWNAALNHIQNSADQIQEIPLLNIPISDMMWFNDMSKQICYQYVKKAIAHCMSFARKRYNIRYGAIHNGALLPSLKN